MIIRKSYRCCVVVKNQNTAHVAKIPCKKNMHKSFALNNENFFLHQQQLQYPPHCTVQLLLLRGLKNVYKMPAPLPLPPPLLERQTFSPGPPFLLCEKQSGKSRPLTEPIRGRTAKNTTQHVDIRFQIFARFLPTFWLCLRQLAMQCRQLSGLSRFLFYFSGGHLCI